MSNLLLIIEQVFQFEVFASCKFIYLTFLMSERLERIPKILSTSFSTSARIDLTSKTCQKYVLI